MDFSLNEDQKLIRDTVGQVMDTCGVRRGAAALPLLECRIC